MDTVTTLRIEFARLLAEPVAVRLAARSENLSLANAEAEIVKAQRLDRSEPLAALAAYITATETASRQLQRSPQDESARHAYNLAVGRIIATIRDAKLDPWTRPYLRRAHF